MEPLTRSLSSQESKVVLALRVEERTEFSEYLGPNCTGIRLEVKANDHDVDLKIDNLSVAHAQCVLALVKTLQGTT